MKFRWSMNVDDFEKMKADIGTEEWIPDNCYRGVAIGSMLWEFVTYEEDKKNMLFINVYEAGTGNYGKLDDGTPYDYIACYGAEYLGLIPNGGFDKFKALVQQKIITMADEETHTIEMINADIEPMWYGFRKE